MRYLHSNNPWNDEELNYDLIEISKIDQEIIQKLVKNIINQPLSDEFYLSFESLLKIGSKAENFVKTGLKKLKQHQLFREEILNLVLEGIASQQTDLNIISKLYHPDFLIRSETIRHLEKEDLRKYLRYILPLLKDKDDAVRWAIINQLFKNDLHKKEKISSFLKEHSKRETNPVIKAKLEKCL